MAKQKDLTNIRFGKLVAQFSVKVAETGRSRWRWSCICDCGNTTLVHTASLTTGKTKSCGCGQILSGKDHGMYKHGYSKNVTTGVDPVYKSWSKIKERCYNVNDPNYAGYGKLGIVMAPEFINDFEMFLSEVGEYPQDGIRYTIDRIDNNKGYISGNMRWATFEQQARNKGKFTNNTSGFTGVSFVSLSGRPYAVATWVELDGRQKSKHFNVKKLGLLPAFARACEYRTEVLERLNKEGAGYSESHGK